MQVLAHRGYHAHHRENTLEAFSAALTLGVDGIETDVWLSADNQLVLFHDRFAPDRNEVAAMTHAQLCAAAGFSVPTLVEALALSKETLWNIELKTPAAARALAAIVRERPEQRFLLSSFYHPVVLELSRELDVECGLIIAHRPMDLRALLPLSMRGNANRLATVVWHHVHLDRELIESAREIGLKTFVYGSESSKDHQNVKEWAVDAIITDFPQFYSPEAR